MVDSKRLQFIPDGLGGENPPRLPRAQENLRRLKSGVSRYQDILLEYFREARASAGVPITQSAEHISLQDFEAFAATYDFLVETFSYVALSEMAGRHSPSSRDLTQFMASPTFLDLPAGLLNKLRIGDTFAEFGITHKDIFSLRPQDVGIYLAYMPGYQQRKIANDPHVLAATADDVCVRVYEAIVRHTTEYKQYTHKAGEAWHNLPELMSRTHKKPLAYILASLRDVHPLTLDYVERVRAVKQADLENARKLSIAATQIMRSMVTVAKSVAAGAPKFAATVQKADTWRPITSEQVYFALYNPVVRTPVGDPLLVARLLFVASKLQPHSDSPKLPDWLGKTGDHHMTDVHALWQAIPAQVTENGEVKSTRQHDTRLLENILRAVDKMPVPPFCIEQLASLTGLSFRSVLQFMVKNDPAALCWRVDGAGWRPHKDFVDLAKALNLAPEALFPKPKDAIHPAAARTEVAAKSASPWDGYSSVSRAAFKESFAHPDALIEKALIGLEGSVSARPIDVLLHALRHPGEALQKDGLPSLAHMRLLAVRKELPLHDPKALMDVFCDFWGADRRRAAALQTGAGGLAYLAIRASLEGQAPIADYADFAFYASGDGEKRPKVLEHRFSDMIAAIKSAEKGEAIDPASAKRVAVAAQKMDVPVQVLFTPSRAGGRAAKALLSAAVETGRPSPTILRQDLRPG